MTFYYQQHLLKKTLINLDLAVVTVRLNQGDREGLYCLPLKFLLGGKQCWLSIQSSSFWETVLTGSCFVRSH